MPEFGSAHENETVTSVLFQPKLFAGTLRLPVIVGGILSSRTVTDPLWTLPRLSIAVDDLVTPLELVFACWLSLLGVGPLATPEPASLAFQLMVTFELFQPAPLAGGDSVAVTVGPVLSRTNEAVFDPLDPVQFP